MTLLCRLQKFEHFLSLQGASWVTAAHRPLWSASVMHTRQGAGLAANLQDDGAGAASQHALGGEGAVQERHGHGQGALDGMPPGRELGAASLRRRPAARQQRLQVVGQGVHDIPRRSCPVVSVIDHEETIR